MFHAKYIFGTSFLYHFVLGEFQILEVNPWTLNPILANIGTFAVLLSPYILIETFIKGVPRTIPEKYAILWLGYIKKGIIVGNILVRKNAQKLGFLFKKKC